MIARSKGSSPPSKPASRIADAIHLPGRIHAAGRPIALDPSSERAGAEIAEVMSDAESFVVVIVPNVVRLSAPPARGAVSSVPVRTVAAGENSSESGGPSPATSAAGGSLFHCKRSAISVDASTDLRLERGL